MVRGHTFAIHVRTLALSLLLVSSAACHSSTGPSPLGQQLVNIVDPDSVNAISLFDSCVGHAFPQTNSPNSAKTYFWPNSTNFSTTDQLQEYAACSGTVSQAQDDVSANELDRGQTIHLSCDASSTSLRYFHVNFAASLVGRHVGAGDVLGTASLLGNGQTVAGTWQFSSNFDLSVSDGDDSVTVDYFTKLNASAFAAWAARGLTAVSQTMMPGGPSCGTYSSYIGAPGILTLTPAR